MCNLGLKFMKTEVLPIVVITDFDSNFFHILNFLIFYPNLIMIIIDCASSKIKSKNE